MNTSIVKIARILFRDLGISFCYIIIQEVTMKKKNRALHLDISAILLKYDPMEVGAAVDADEYDLEAATILSRIKEVHSKEELTDIVFEEFESWYGKNAVGDRQKYEKMAAEIWEIWHRYHTQAA